MRFEELKKNGNLLAEEDLYNNGIYIGTEYIYEHKNLIYVSTKYTNKMQYSGKSTTEWYEKEEFIKCFDGMNAYVDAVEKVKVLL